MKLMTKKLIKNQNQQQLSPTRKPKFQRTQINEHCVIRKRSSSFRSNSSKSLLDQPNIKTKFVTPGGNQDKNRFSIDHNQNELKLGLLIESRIKDYKRETTPFKSKKDKKEMSIHNPEQQDRFVTQIKYLQQLLTLRQTQIAELEDNNKRLKQQISTIDTLKQQNQQVHQTCKKLQLLVQEKQTKLKYLQDLYKQNEDCLMQTRDTLEKLQKQMQQNKIQQLQRQKLLLLQKISLLQKRFQFEHQQVQKMDVVNSKLQKDIQILELTNQKLQRQLFSRSSIIESMKQQSLVNQITILKQQLAQSHTEHQKYLQSIINVQKTQISELKSANKVICIKLDVVLKKLQQKDKQNKKGNKKQLTELQSRFRKFLLQYKNFRKQYNEMLKKNIQSAKEDKKRRRNESQDSISYSLTPEKNKV